MWKRKAGGSGGEISFLKRLKADGLTEETARERSGAASWNDREPLPAWCGEANALLETLSAEEPLHRDTLWFKPDQFIQEIREQAGQGGKKEESGIAEFRENLLSLMPFLAHAERRLEQRLGAEIRFFSHQALSDLSRILVNGLYGLTYKAIAERRSIFILRKESFGFLMKLSEEDRIKYTVLYREELLAGGWKEIFTEYPMLPRLMVTVIRHWVDNAAGFALHLREDQDALAQKFNRGTPLGKVTAVKGSISDSHNKGKGVLLVSFEPGTTIVYKPRNLGIDLAYKELVRSLADMGFPYELKAPEVLRFEDHGWIEFIAYRPAESAEEVKTFYRRAGALLCLVYALGGNDFHGENIIAQGGQPVLIDLETIIAYKMLQFNEEYEDVKEAQDFVDLMQESVLGLGFLPVWLTAGSGACIDFGALTGGIPSSMPGLSGKAVPVFDYKNELLEGFENAYDFLLKNRQGFFNDAVTPFFSETVLRVLLRPTNVYAKMLHRVLNPEFLKDGFLHSVELERFAPAYLNKVEEDKVKWLWKLFLYERNSLEARDIPIFYGHACERHIRNSEEILCEDFFADPVIERIRKKLFGLSPEDKARQAEFIRETLSIYHRKCHHGPEAPSAGENANGSIHAQPSVGKTANTASSSAPPVASPAMYGEFSGAALNEETLLCEAKSIYGQIMEKSIPLGEDALSWVAYQYDLIHDKIFIRTANVSLYDGVLGIALFTSALYGCCRDPEIKETALLMLSPFRQSLRNEDYKMPLYRMPSGLGNGLGGMIKALIFMGDYLGEPSLHEDAVYMAEQITPEQIKKEKDMSVLSGLAGLMDGLLTCHGRLGHPGSLALASLCEEQLSKNSGKIENSENSKNIEKITGKTAHGAFCCGAERGNSQGEENSGDHLCCGTSGRIDYLIETGIKEGRPELLTEADTLIRRMIDRRNQSGQYRIDGTDSEFVSNPSLFQGLSGIGYELLRRLAPERIRSILY